MQPYMKPGLRWEDPLDGYGPGRHRAHKKGARQHRRAEQLDQMEGEPLEGQEEQTHAPRE